MLADKVFEIQPGVSAAFGNGSVAKLGRRVAALGEKRVLVVTDPGLVEAGVVAKVSAALEAESLKVEVFSGVHANPTRQDVEAGVEVLRANAKAVVVAVGGGSSMDAAKVIALLAPNGGNVSDFPVGCRPAKPGHIVVAVPTTAGTGSETNMYGVVTDKSIGRKVMAAHASVLPALVVLDPELTLGLSPAVTALSGMDALTHAIEAFTSNRANPFSDALALRAIAAIATYLPRVVGDGKNLESRSEMLLAAHLAGRAFSSSALGICHAMGHPLSARLDLAHGQSLATLLPHVMRFNLGVCETKYAQVGIALGVADPTLGDAQNAERAILAVEKLSTRVGTAKRASELGVTRALLPTLVEDAMADMLMTGTPRFPEARDVHALYEAAF
jgi:alcohol dehydrogenase class IV